jgi:ribonuclease HI
MTTIKSLTDSHFIIYTDGACSGNPGHGGWGSIICIDEEVTELGEYASSTTNNRMEITAALKALEYVLDVITRKKRFVFSIQLYTDSVYVIKGITQWIHGWKKKGWKNSSGENVINRDLWQKLDEVVQALHAKANCQILWSYVRGHSGVAGNERCDEIAVAFTKNTYIHLYHGDRKTYMFDIMKTPLTESLPDHQWQKNKENNDSSHHKIKSYWYIVLKNGVISRYKTWSECEGVVKGASNVKYKKVSSSDEEQTVLKSWGK